MKGRGKQGESYGSKKVGDAIDTLGWFVRDFLDANAKDVRGVDYVRSAIRPLIAAKRFNTDDYEIQGLLRVSKSKKGALHVELNSHFKNLVPHEKQMRDLEKHRAIHGRTENEDLFGICRTFLLNAGLTELFKLSRLRRSSIRLMCLLIMLPPCRASPRPC